VQALLPAPVSRDLESTVRLLQDKRPVRAVAFCFCEL
jgi:hypothetical protein